MKLELNIDSEEFLYESSILVKSFLAQSGMEQELEEKKNDAYRGRTADPCGL